MNQDPYQPPQPAPHLPPAFGSHGQRSIKRLKRIDPVIAGTVQAVIMAAFGLLYVPFGLLMMFGGFASGDAGGIGAGLGVGLAIMIFAPVLYGLLGFLSGLLAAFVYNVAVRFTGGLRLEFEDEF
ncbi:hypothetical protein [Haloferula sp.]|uniref:hypothetical protein n=1 Tax=Haloferula sp. TaxID=2497595 RepID=UPI003C78AA35